MVTMRDLINIVDESSSGTPTIDRHQDASFKDGDWVHHQLPNGTNLIGKIQYETGHGDAADGPSYEVKFFGGMELIVPQSELTKATPQEVADMRKKYFR